MGQADFDVDVFESEEQLEQSGVRERCFVRVGQITYTPVDVLDVQGNQALVRYPDGETGWEAYDSAVHVLPAWAKLA